MEYTFSLWEEGSRDAKALHDLLGVRQIWEQQRTDVGLQENAMTFKYEGCYVCIFRTDGVAVGFMLFMPQKCGLYETHLAMVGGVSPRQMVRAIQFAVLELFTVNPDARTIAAPCPDWNPKLARIAAFVKNLMLGHDRAIHAQYRVKNYAKRNGEMWGATIVPISRKECAPQLERRSAGQCH